MTRVNSLALGDQFTYSLAEYFVKASVGSCVSMFHLILLTSDVAKVINPLTEWFAPMTRILGLGIEGRLCLTT